MRWAEKKSYKPYKEHIVIEEIPVQFIPVYNELVKEAVENSADEKYGKTKTRILKAEYLIAIMLQTFRSKDREKIKILIHLQEIANGIQTSSRKKERMWKI